jgi:hypothetical protein
MRVRAVIFALNKVACSDCKKYFSAQVSISFTIAGELKNMLFYMG